MKATYNVGSFTADYGEQYYIYVNDDTNKRLCLMVGDYNTEYCATTLADTLNNRKEMKDDRR